MQLSLLPRLQEFIKYTHYYKLLLLRTLMVLFVHKSPKLLISFLRPVFVCLMFVECGLYLGHLLIKNKALGAGKRFRTTRFVPGAVSPIGEEQLQIAVSLSFMCKSMNIVTLFFFHRKSQLRRKLYRELHLTFLNARKMQAAQKKLNKLLQTMTSSVAILVRH